MVIFSGVAEFTDYDAKSCDNKSFLSRKKPQEGIAY